MSFKTLGHSQYSFAINYNFRWSKSMKSQHFSCFLLLLPRAFLTGKLTRIRVRYLFPRDVHTRAI